MAQLAALLKKKAPPASKAEPRPERGASWAGLLKDFTAPASPTSGIADYAIEGQKKRKKKRVRLKPGASLAGLVVKWDPNQPRDEIGRWTDAGGGSTDQIAMGRATAEISTPATNHMAALNAEHLLRLGPQAANELTAIYRAAADAKPAFDADLTSIARESGSEAKLPGLKGSDRATEKILADYGGQASQIKDVLRGTLMSDTPAEAKAALDQIRGRFDVLPSGFRNTLDPAADPVDGYRDIKMNVRVNGIIAEVQVNVPAMLEVKSRMHVQYEERRTIEGRIATEGRQPTGAEQARIDALNATMKAAYDPVWKRISGGG